MEVVKEFCLNPLPSSVPRLRDKLAALGVAIGGEIPVQYVNVIFKFSGVMATYRCVHRAS